MVKISCILVQFGTGFTCYGAPKKSDASEMHVHAWWSYIHHLEPSHQARSLKGQKNQRNFGSKFSFNFEPGWSPMDHWKNLVWTSQIGEISTMLTQKFGSICHCIQRLWVSSEGLSSHNACSIVAHPMLTTVWPWHEWTASNRRNPNFALTIQANLHVYSAATSQFVGLMFPKCILMVANPIATATNLPQEWVDSNRSCFTILLQKFGPIYNCGQQLQVSWEVWCFQNASFMRAYNRHCWVLVWLFVCHNFSSQICLNFLLSQREYFPCCPTEKTSLHYYLLWWTIRSLYTYTVLQNILNIFPLFCSCGWYTTLKTHGVRGSQYGFNILLRSMLNAFKIIFQSSPFTDSRHMSTNTPDTWVTNVLPILNISCLSHSETFKRHFKHFSHVSNDLSIPTSWSNARPRWNTGKTCADLVLVQCSLHFKCFSHMGRPHTLDLILNVIQISSHCYSGLNIEYM
jgi:hypothetical protein